MRERFLECNGVRLHVVEQGPEDGPLVVFLHGFPELWWAWRHQLEAFATAGFRAVAPDMRGFNESEKPEGVDAYDVEVVAADVASLVRQLSAESKRDPRDTIVVGHDWGAIVAWGFAQWYPTLYRKLAILNVPHPVVMQRALRTNRRQIRRSWYVFFFQLPFLPERLIARNGYAFVRRMLTADGFSPDEVEVYVDAIAKPRAAGSGMNYYRAAIRRVVTGRVPRIVAIEAPVLVIWGDEDKYLGKELAEPPPRWVPNARVVHIPGASHWVQNAAPDRVNDLLLELAR